MPIGNLRADDLRRHPIWQFAEDVEGEPDQDETSVEPVDEEHVPIRVDSRFVATNYRASDGTEYLGLVDVSSDPDTLIKPCAIVTADAYAPLPDSGHWMAESVLKFAEGELGRSRQSLYPLSFTLRVLIENENEVRSGQFQLPTAAA
jgi:hypothetical protein